MPGRALTIRLGNGVEVLGSEEYHFDADVIEACGTFCISHAHSDHLPKRVAAGSKVVASETTLRCLNDRSKKQVAAAPADKPIAILVRRGDNTLYLALGSLSRNG